MANINGVKIIKLKKIPDERGTIYHMLRASDEHFTKFGKIYFSKIYKGAIKGWHIHKQITFSASAKIGEPCDVIFTHVDVIFKKLEIFIFIFGPFGGKNGDSDVSKGVKNLIF